MTLVADRYTTTATLSAEQKIQDIITKGVKAGTAPATVARRISAAVSTVTSGRAMTIARTEMMVAQWEAARADFARDGLVQEWQWLCRLDGRTCLICRASHGTRHPKSVRLESHPNCRCAMAPIIFGSAPVSDADTGEARFARLSLAEQRRILGPARFAAYQRTGTLSSLLTRTPGARHIVPLRSLVTPRPTTARAEARKLISAARLAAPKTLSDLTTIGSKYGGTLRGTAHQLKTESSMLRKITNDVRDTGWSPAYTAGRVYDGLRYTYTLSPSAYTAGIKAIRSDLTAAGYTHVRTKNFWGGDGQAAVQSVYLTPTGTYFEVQYHTPLTLQVKSPSHDLYDEAKGLDPTSPKAKSLDKQIQELWAPVQADPPPDVMSIKTE